MPMITTNQIRVLSHNIIQNQLSDLLDFGNNFKLSAKIINIALKEA